MLATPIQRSRNALNFNAHAMAQMFYGMSPMKAFCSIGALLLAGCASAPPVAIEPPATPRAAVTTVETNRSVADAQLDRSYEPPRAVELLGPQVNAETPSEGLSEIVSHALKQVGVPYRYGGNSPRHGFDCSGFVRYVYKQVGVALPRTTEGMSQVGVPIRRRELEPGDLVFFDTRRKPFSHVGIYLGDQKFIHAPARGGTVELVDMQRNYWRERYMGARRIGL